MGDLGSALAPWASALGPLLTIWFIKSQFTKMDKKLSRMEAESATCRLDNEKHFATKEDTAKLWARSDEHHESIGRIKGKLNLD